MINRLLGNPIYNDVKLFVRKFDSLLYSFLNELVEPVFTKKIPTAAVSFARKDLSVCIKFMFNKEFWDGLNYNEKNFVFCHELLHVIFRHGIRGQQYFNTLPKEKQSFKLLNICQDICINQIIVDQYMKDIPHVAMPILKNLCFVETVFKPEHQHMIVKGESFIYYYEKYIELYGIKHLPPDVRLLDFHGVGEDGLPLDEEPLTDDELEDLEGLFDEIEEAMSNNGIDIEELEEMMQSEGFSVSPDLNSAEKTEKEIKKGKSLDDLFKIVIKKAFSNKYDIAKKSNWFGFDRRTSGPLARMSPDLNLPVASERKREIPKRHKVLIYLDMSGSCRSYSEKFMALTCDLPEDKYDAHICVFADSVSDVEVIKTKDKVSFKYGRVGSGTNIKKVIDNAKVKLSKEKFDAIFVLTDGCYTDIKNDKVNDYSYWYFFMTPSYKDNTPSKSKIFKIGKL